jgi:hypothetical protein
MMGYRPLLKRGFTDASPTGRVPSGVSEFTTFTVAVEFRDRAGVVRFDRRGVWVDWRYGWRDSSVEGGCLDRVH